MRDVHLDVAEHEITAFIGLSGCGKTTLLRCFNRMNDLIESARAEGTIHYHGVDLYDPAVSAVEVRRRIGMVFQKPNPFPKTVYDNVAYGPRLLGIKKKSELDDRRALAPRRGTVGRGALPPQDVRFRHVRRPAAAALHRQGHRRRARGDPHGRALLGLGSDRHGPHRGADAGDQAAVHDRDRHPQHAAGGRVSDRTAFFTTEVSEDGDRRNRVLVEFDRTEKMFSNPSDERTENYVTDGSGERSAHGLPPGDRGRPQHARASGRLGDRGDPAPPASCSRAISRSDYLISADDEIDARSLDLEEEIYRLMLQAPVAVDLRCWCRR